MSDGASAGAMGAQESALTPFPEEPQPLGSAASIPRDTTRTAQAARLPNLRQPVRFPRNT